ncbi:ribosomal protein, S18B [Halocaridina rubra]|uniref:Small ribosomal subunit protein mS40 n=1 Tax=Halocaridina rubra TaxID=373956 RepID=A0AAN8X3D9_HALRR
MHRSLQLWPLCNRLLGFRNTVRGGQVSMIQERLPTCNIYTIGANLCENEVEEGSQEKKEIDDRYAWKYRDRIIPVETSIRYLQSDAYKTTYGDDPVWKKYRRNFKGQHPPPQTRKTCIRKNKIMTGSPCPICRDEYLVVDYTNIDLIKQFISPHTGEILSYQTTNICMRRHKELLIAMEKARDIGLLTFDVPFRAYNYSEYYKPPQNGPTEK